ncbi:LytTR family DNA-binding domain-containing protein [Ramlibacter sp. WS9]|uniref:LytR/AlgR family response regulator transcription factor n=1 Tax=Ramlibacter sp. WS9 TaxID=1882741 RepID=UPI001143D2C7|nr:LytTR family DNA-binding domain-containing protein [Ramlibacter sp. WS9]ROZ61913.1 DNA-binding response regulator [Ramlibacter sp. WS9]
MTNALIADDEPLLRERLASLLKNLWPELLVTQARNGREAVELFDQNEPQVAFLDVHMPGMNGIEVARCIGGRAQVVFVTAFDQYAVEAFRQGAIDYLVKPIEEQRLAETVQRLRGRLQAPAHAPQPEWETTLERMALQLRDKLAPRPWLKWIKASVGATVRLIPVEQVIYVKSDNKYTMVVWEGGEALIRKTIRELADELDPERFAQVHRSAIVCLDRVSHFTHGPGDSGELHLKDRSDKVTVSRSYLHLFQQM